MLVIFVALSLLALAGAEDFIEPSINCAPERLRADRFQVCTRGYALSSLSCFSPLPNHIPWCVSRILLRAKTPDVTQRKDPRRAFSPFGDVSATLCSDYQRP